MIKVEADLIFNADVKKSSVALLKMMLFQLVLRYGTCIVLLDYLVFSNIRNLHILSFLQHK